MDENIPFLYSLFSTILTLLLASNKFFSSINLYPPTRMTRLHTLSVLLTAVSIIVESWKGMTSFHFPMRVDIPAARIILSNLFCILVISFLPQEALNRRTVRPPLNVKILCTAPFRLFQSCVKNSLHTGQNDPAEIHLFSCQ